VQAPLDFLRSAMPHYENFDSRFAFAQDDQVGAKLLMYAWYRFADVKNGKPFLELRCEAKSAFILRFCL